jgi:hypothetical protein
MKYRGNNNLIGQAFSQLNVLEYVGNSKWKCQCSCGNIIYIKTTSLTSGKIKSCGCLKRISSPRNYGPKKDLTN